MKRWSAFMAAGKGDWSDVLVIILEIFGTLGIVFLLLELGHSTEMAVLWGGVWMGGCIGWLWHKGYEDYKRLRKIKES